MIVKPHERGNAPQKTYARIVDEKMVFCVEKSVGKDVGKGGVVQ